MSLLVDSIQMPADGELLRRQWLVELDRRDRLVRDMQAVAPDTICLKGPTLRRLYPAQWVRTYWDIDLVALSDEAFWRVFVALVGAGWELTSFTCAIKAKELRLLAVLKECAHNSDKIPPLLLDLSNFVSFDSVVSIGGGEIRAIENCSSAALQVVAICDELRQRRMSARDVVDLAWIFTASDSVETRDATAAAVALFGLEPEWSMLARHLSPLLPEVDGLGWFSTTTMVRRYLERSLLGVHDLSTNLFDKLSDICHHMSEAKILEEFRSGLALLAIRLSRTAFARGSVRSLQYDRDCKMLSRSSRLVYGDNYILLCTPAGTFKVLE